MKRMILSAAVGLAALAGATAFAEPPGFPRLSRGVPPPASCELQVLQDNLHARVAPRNARDWSLRVRAPGLEADQSGPLYGDSTVMGTVSTLHLSHNRPAPGRFERVLEADPDIIRPLRADLIVRGHDGRTVCSDSLDLRPNQRRAYRPRWMN
ncbi:MAG: hypothetical protein RIA71_11885 [Oceanicaulis sp.]